MARPIKSGLDYFPLDTTLDDRFELIEAKYGPTGFMVVIKLYQKIYATNGYYYPWGEQEQLLFSKRINVDINSINEIIDYCINVGIFSEEMFEKGVLTSHGIQKRYIDATLRRRELTFCSDLLLIDQTLIPVIVGKNTRSIVFISYISTQSKRNEMKRNEIESKEPAAINAPGIVFSKSEALNPNRSGISQEVESDRHHWNEIGAKPPKEKLIMNFDGITPTIQTYARERRHKAMENYEAIRKSPDHELRPEYGSLDGFLREGVEKYVDEADPWTRCKKKQLAGIKKPEPVYGFIDDDEDFSK